MEPRDIENPIAEEDFRYQLRVEKQEQNYYQKQREAILNDSLRKRLFLDLFELYANSMPIVLKTKDNRIQCYYPEEVEEVANKIREQIVLRDNQIFEEHS